MRLMIALNQDKVMRRSLLTAAALFTSISFVAPFTTAQTTGGNQIPEDGSTSPLYLETTRQTQVDVTSPDVGVVIQNQGGEITVGIIEPVPSPAPTTAPVPIQPTTAQVNPTAQPQAPTNAPPGQVAPTSQPRLPEPTTSTSNPTFPSPTTTKLPSEPAPTEGAYIKVTPTPIPQPEDKSDVPVVGPIIDVIGGVFKPKPAEPVFEQPIIDPVTGIVQPEFVLVTPTPTPKPIPILSDIGNAFTDIFGGGSTSSLTSEQQLILKQNAVSSKSNEVQELFIKASNLISPEVASALGLSPTSLDRIDLVTGESEGIFQSYLANYELKVAADQEGNVVIQRGDAAVKVSVPVVMNSQNRSFSVMTEKGTIAVTYYPDTVKDELALNGYINADLDMNLGFRDNDLVYVANGCEEEFLFAFLPVCPQKQVIISARDLTVHQVRQSTVAQIVDWFAI